MKVKTASRISLVKEYFFSRKLKEIAALRAEGKDIINLGIGSPDLPPSEKVVERLHHESSKDNQHAYQSYVGHPELRKAFARWYQKYFKVALNPDSEILPLIGSKEGIMHISMTYLESGDEVLIPNPGYPAYSATANLTGATPQAYLLSEKNNWLPDLDALAKKDLSKTKLMWINYPHMPTGALANKSFFKELIDFARSNSILICNDNPYSFILNDEQLSILSVEGAKEVAIELNSLSKSHNMAGWRIGMMAAHEDRLKEVIKFKSNMDSGMFLPAQLAAVEALDSPKEWYDSLNMQYRKRREKAFELLDLLNCSFQKNQTGMFVWAKIPSSYKDGYELSDEILYKGNVFITPGGIFGTQGDGYVRVSLCSKVEQLEESMKRIKSIEQAEA